MYNKAFTITIGFIGFFIIFLFFNFYGNSQTIDNYFILYGNIKGIDTGKVQLIPVGRDSGYHSFVLKNRFANILNENFKFTGKIDYPHAFYFEFSLNGKTVHTNILFLQQGVQKIKWNIDSAYDQTPEITGSKVNEEFINNYLPAYNPVSEIYKSMITESQTIYQKYGRNIPETTSQRLNLIVDKFRKANNEFLRLYLTKNPDSYISLWKLIERFDESGYKDYYDEVFQKFSERMKSTKSGKFLGKTLAISKATAIGRPFPETIFTNKKDKKITVDFAKYEYTLVDLWFSSCGPCIKEFPALIEIYNKTKNKGFNIIGVSVDRTEDKSKWLSAINKHNLIWEQYWDKNKIFTEKYSINSFPSNFLLDKNKNILARNLNPTQLKEFLDKNLQ